MKIILTPKPTSSENVSNLKKQLRKNGIKSEDISTTPINGQLGRGIVGGIAAILTGGSGFFTKLGEAIVKYVELKKVDVSMKNSKGEEITLSSTLPHDQLHNLISGFFEKEIKKTPAKKTKKTSKKASSTTAKKATTTRKKASSTTAKMATTTRKKSSSTTAKKATTTRKKK